MPMGLTGPDGVAGQLGMFETIWGSAGVEAVGSSFNPITVDGSASYTGIDFDLSHHPDGSDEGPPGEPGQLTYTITMPEAESGSMVIQWRLYLRVTPPVVGTAASAFLEAS